MEIIRNKKGEAIKVILTKEEVRIGKLVAFYLNNYKKL